ncbi:MAG: hypothetical protein R3D45_09050 [Rhizobiaceae bacterium]
MAVRLAGALIGLLLAAVEFVLLQRLSARVELDETKRVLRVVGVSQFVLFPAFGWFLAPFVVGD